TYSKIARTLNVEGIPSPGYFYYQRVGKNDPRRVNHQWCDATVKSIIRNEVYIGNMVQGKFETLSYKSRKIRAKPEDEWIRVEGTHEPIISRDVWDTVVNLDQKRVRKSPAIKTGGSIFTGLLYCADCGFKMSYHTERRKYSDGHTKVYKSFLCGNYNRSGKTACTIHGINEDALTAVVLQDIREKAQYAEYDRERLVEQIIYMKEKEKHSRLASYEQELKAAAARITELEKLMQNLYEDKCTGVVPPTVFQTLMQKYEMERAQKAAVLPELEQKLRTQLEARQEADRWTDIIRRYTEITELDETILFALVDRIEIGETKRIGKLRVCDVKVSYRYVGNIDDAVAQEEREADEEAV
ncbi:MAG: recombinase family protein, partial [Oscillospiraceae bacterium]|nr:recombinase family protein [Oscillospiraceae bacterium]